MEIRLKTISIKLTAIVHDYFTAAIYENHGDHLITFSERFKICFRAAAESSFRHVKDPIRCAYCG